MDDSSGDFICPDNATLIRELCPVVNATQVCSEHVSSPATFLGTLAVLCALVILVTIIGMVICIFYLEGGYAAYYSRLGWRWKQSKSPAR